jgi:hypothetical protein
MNKTATQIIFVSFAVLASLLAITKMLELHSSYWGVIFIYAIFSFILIFLGGRLPFDGKFLIILCLGYAIGGKGFAYLTPMEPFYVSEIGLGLLMLGFILRGQSGGGLAPTFLHILIYIFCIYSAARVFFNMQAYGMMSIRDAALCYYGLYYIGAFSALSNVKFYRTFEKSIPWVLLLGFIAQISYKFLIYLKLGNISGWFMKVHLPHPDITLPLAVAFAVVTYVKFITTKRIRYLPVLVFSMGLIMMSKSAGVFDLAVLCTMLGFAAKRAEFFLVGGAAVVTAFFGIVVLTQLSSSGNLPDFLVENEHVQTLTTAVTGDTSQRNTTDWRIEWWRVIYEDTIEDNPLLGAGYGGDITSSFFYEYYGEARMAGQAGAARYPHSVLFTVFGRLGISGMLLFLPLFIWIIVFCGKFASRYLRGDNYKIEHLVAFCIVVAGWANSLVQATYETPYAAIIHWTFLGYMAFEYYRPNYHRQLETKN